MVGAVPVTLSTVETVRVSIPAALLVSVRAQRTLPMSAEVTV